MNVTVRLTVLSTEYYAPSILKLRLIGRQRIASYFQPVILILVTIIILVTS